MLHFVPPSPCIQSAGCAAAPFGRPAKIGVDRRAASSGFHIAPAQSAQPYTIGHWASSLRPTRPHPPGRRHWRRQGWPTKSYRSSPGLGGLAKTVGSVWLSWRLGSARLSGLEYVRPKRIGAPLNEGRSLTYGARTSRCRTDSLCEVQDPSQSSSPSHGVSADHLHPPQLIRLNHPATPSIKNPSTIWPARAHAMHHPCRALHSLQHL
jgi:hypothetical protein